VADETSSPAKTLFEGSSQPETGHKGPEVYRPGSDVFTAPQKPPAAAPTANGEVTLNFENTNLREVVKVILGDILQQNYAIDPNVTGSVTLQTGRPLPRDALAPTLEMLLRMNGAALIYEQGLYNVVPSEEAVSGLLAPQLGGATTPLPKGYSVRIVPLEFIAAKEMQSILEPFAVPGNVIRVDEERNLLILAGTSQEIRSLLGMIRIFDVDWLEGKSVAVFTPEFVEAKTLAEELEKLFGDQAEGPLAGLIRLEPIERLNAVLAITPRKEYLEKVAQWVQRLDRETGAVGRRLFVYPVQNGKAADLAAVLTQIFQEEGAEELPPAELAPGLEPVEITSSAQVPRQGPSENLQESIRTETPQLQREAPGQLQREVPGEVQSKSTPGEGLEAAGQTRLKSVAQATPTAQEISVEGVTIQQPGTVRIIADETNNALLILATGQQYKEIVTALRQLDIVPLQVLIEVTLADILLTGELRYGVEWFFKHHLDGKTGEFRLGQLPTTAEDGSIVPFTGIPGGFSFAVTAADAVRALLTALADDSRLDIIASPSLMVLNNQSANINIGDEIPVVTQQQQSVAQTANIINSVERVNTGVQLTVSPRVNEGGLVIMEIVQNVSQPREEQSELGPEISNREITSTVAVQSGETVVLGGLISENNSFTHRGIPGLYKVPIVGPLFGRKDVTKRRTELIVLITPRALRDVHETRQITEEFRNKMQGIRPWPTERVAPKPTSRPPSNS
jgi:general secretion pathway protein D